MSRHVQEADVVDNRDYELSNVVMPFFASLLICALDLAS